MLFFGDSLDRKPLQTGRKKIPFRLSDATPGIYVQIEFIEKQLLISPTASGPEFCRHF